MGKIVIIGSISMDYAAITNKFPVAGETLLASHFNVSGGGKGANQAIAAAIFSNQVKVIGMLGIDDNGKRLLQSMQEKGIDTSCIEFCDTPTGNALVNVEQQSGRSTIVVNPGANHQLTVAIIEKYREVIEAADIVVMQLEIPMETVKAAAKIAHQANVPVLLNPSPAQRLDEDLLKLVTYITPNETELLRLVNALETFKGAQMLQQMGVKNVIVTLGAKGCYLKSIDQELRVDSFKVKPIDTTAAGDAFSGALAAQLAKKVNINEALRIANATGALTTLKLGAQEAIPTLDEVMALLQQ